MPFVTILHKKVFFRISSKIAILVFQTCTKIFEFEWGRWNAILKAFLGNFRNFFDLEAVSWKKSPKGPLKHSRVRDFLWYRGSVLQNIFIYKLQYFCEDALELTEGLDDFIGLSALHFYG